MHYSSSQKILLVGEGDFSFAACLGKEFGSAVNMVATSLDSEGNKTHIYYSHRLDIISVHKMLTCTLLINFCKLL